MLDEKTAENYYLRGRYDRNITERFFWYGGVGWDRNEFAGIKNRMTVFGGVGNLWGTLVGALTLGIANKFLEPYAGAVLAKIAILVLIILFIQKRPRGLFALKGRAIEA